MEDLKKNSVTEQSAEPEGVEVAAEQPAVQAPAASSEPLLNAEPISIDQAPLLSDEISIMAHAGSAGQPQTSPDFKVSGDLFGGPKAPITPTPEEPAVPKFEFPEDVPEMNIGGATTSSDPSSPLAAGGGSIPSEIKGAIDNSMADMICELYKDGAPELTFTWSKLKDQDIKVVKLLGDPLITESAIDFNKGAKKQLKERAAADAKLLNGPLTRVLNEKQIKTSPMGDLMITVCFIMLMNFLLIKELKGQTNDLMNAIRQRLDERDAKEQAQQEATVV